MLGLSAEDMGRQGVTGWRIAIAWVRFPRPWRRMDAIEVRRAASDDPCSTRAEVDWFREAWDKSTLKTIKRGIHKKKEIPCLITASKREESLNRFFRKQLANASEDAPGLLNCSSVSLAS